MVLFEIGDAGKNARITPDLEQNLLLLGSRPHLTHLGVAEGCHLNSRLPPPHAVVVVPGGPRLCLLHRVAAKDAVEHGDTGLELEGHEGTAGRILDHVVMVSLALDENLREDQGLRWREMEGVGMSESERVSE